MVFASGNPDKLMEVKDLFSSEGIDVLGIKDFGLDNFEVDEDRPDLEGNAEKKARALFDIVKTPVFADDTGLFVPFLNGAPGVYSARYAGENATYSENREKLLEDMKFAPKDQRSAYFKTVIAYVDKNGDVEFFEGRVDGYISEEEIGDKGFGYDAIFYVSEKQKTFAEMTLSEKAEISHRARALRAFKAHLQRL